MRVCLARLGVVFLVLIWAGQAKADLPLTVEDLITEQGRVRLDVSLTYANVDRQGVSTGAVSYTHLTLPTKRIV